LPVPGVWVQRRCLVVAGDGSRVVAGQALHGAQSVEGLGLTEQVAEAAEQVQCLLEAAERGRVVAS
jgi:hypothetical protein